MVDGGGGPKNRPPAAPLSLSPLVYLGGARGGPHGRAPGVVISPSRERIRLVSVPFYPLRRSEKERCRGAMLNGQKSHMQKNQNRARNFAWHSGVRVRAAADPSEDHCPRWGRGSGLNGVAPEKLQPAVCLPFFLLSELSLNSGLPRLPKLWPGLMTTVVVKTVAVSTASHRMSMHRISTWQKLGAHDGRQSRNWRQGART